MDNAKRKLHKSNPIVKTAIRISLEEFQTWSARKWEEFVKMTPPPDMEGIKCDFDNPYINRAGIPLAMDWIEPLDVGKKELPVIVLIHGGMLVMADRSTTRRLGVAIAKRGYLVAILDYRVIPNTDVCGQFDDICAGLDFVGKKLLNYNVDFRHMFLVAESAGAFLATYVAAMQGSKKLQDAIGYMPSKFMFNAMGMISGMFYTAEDDLLGRLMGDQYFGDKITDDEFMQYMNPNHPEIMNHMPPTFLITSKGDFLNNYTLDFKKHLKQFNKDSHLLYFSNPDLIHSFLTFMPDCPEGVKALDKMLAWFDKKADEADRRIHVTDKEKAKRDKVKKRMADKTITKQKMWKLVEETNSVSDERINNIAVIDGRRSYTYRQMFREWNRYAEIFTALGISGKNHSRVAITSAIATEVIFSTYALNIIGASVSIVTDSETMMPQRFRDMIRTEHITDLILVDYCVIPSFVKNLINDRDELGIKNIIIIHSDVTGPCTSKAMRESANWINEKLRNIPGVVFLRDLFVKYETTPFTPARSTDNESAVIFHTSGTTKGIHKPIPMSDQAMNEAAVRMMDIPQINEYEGHAKVLISVDPANAYGTINQIHMPLALGCTLVIVPMGANTLSFCKAITYYKADIVFTSATYIEAWFGAVASGNLKVDFSSIKMMVIGGSYLSDATRKRYNEFLAANGASIKLTNGYGLSEVGGACILENSNEEGDRIGVPLPGVDILIYDQEDEKYHALSEGQRSGIMYISSSSLSSGKIDGENFFETEEIDGKQYICTYDQVRVNEGGSLTFLGRMDRYYINNEGVRFDAGLVETLMSKQEGIKECAVIPLYDKVLHDTQPGLVVALSDRESAPDKVLKDAMVKEFIQEGHFSETNLPVLCTVVEGLPHNATGKIDVHGLTSGEIPGMHFTVTPVRVDNKLVDIVLAPVPSAVWQYSLPEGFEEEAAIYNQPGAIVMLLASVADDLVVFPFFGYWVNFVKEELPDIYKKLGVIDLTGLIQKAKSGAGLDMKSIIAGLQPNLINQFSHLSGKEQKEMQTLFELFKSVGAPMNQGYGMPQMQSYGMPQMPQMQGYGMNRIPQMQGYGMNPMQMMQGCGMPQMQGYGQAASQGFCPDQAPQMQGYGMNPMQMIQGCGMPQMQGYGQAESQGFCPDQAPQMQSYGMNPMQGCGMPQMQGFGMDPMQMSQCCGMPQMQGYGQAESQGFCPYQTPQMQNYGMNPMQGCGMPQMQGFGMDPMQMSQCCGMPQMQGYGQAPFQGFCQDQSPQMQGYGQNPSQNASAAQGNTMAQTQGCCQDQVKEAAPKEGDSGDGAKEGKKSSGEDDQPAFNLQGYGANAQGYGAGAPAVNAQAYGQAVKNVNQFMGSMFRASDTSHDYEED